MAANPAVQCLLGGSDDYETPTLIGIGRNDDADVRFAGIGVGSGLFLAHPVYQHRRFQALSLVEGFL